MNPDDALIDILDENATGAMTYAAFLRSIADLVESLTDPPDWAPPLSRLVADQLLTVALRLYTKVNAEPDESLGSFKLPEPLPLTGDGRQRGSYQQSRGTFVYVARTASGEPLYIGIADNPILRLASHKTMSAWWPFMHSVAWEEYEDRWTALAAERWLITEHRPPYNIDHNPDVQGRRHR